MILEADRNAFKTPPLKKKFTARNRQLQKITAKIDFWLVGQRKTASENQF